jgi:hydrogenase maturation protein HypF
MRPKRLRLAIRGAVQGVGFRPFVYRLAGELGLKGWVNNSTQGVFIEAEGGPAQLEQFRLRLEAERPPRSFIQSLEAAWLDPLGYASFEIRASQTGGRKTALVLPDIATCPDCRREVFEPGNRRYFYPFTNCTNCGPRFSIIHSLPYDRANTSMRKFALCPQCQAEYDDPRDRRFHAQPNACPQCGPHLELWDRQGKVLSGGGGAGAPGSPPAAPAVLAAAAAAIRAGRIVAVKGLGGFHLVVAAHADEAVRRLRQLKGREEKPFALMFPSLAAVQAVCQVSPAEERLLRSPEAPIVLLGRRPEAGGDCQLAVSLAPGNPNLGVMLPYTPLHHLLLSLLAFPVVATSGNLSDEPICTEAGEALERLGDIADLFLVHDRPIVRHVDDSIVRVMLGRELVLRRARGFAPLPIEVGSAAWNCQFSIASCQLASGEHRPKEKRRGRGKSEIGNRKSDLRRGSGESVLAVGAHLKNTIALTAGSQAFISQHIGDLETDQAYEAFRRVIADFERLYETQPATVAADAHPDYLSTKYARARASAAAPSPGLGYVSVQHHVAHVLSCMAENQLTPPVLGVAWDGTGYGLDGTVWGGEFFLVTEAGWERVAHFRPFPLPGGERAVKEPRRAALGLLFAMFGEAALGLEELAPVRAFSRAELAALKTMLARRLNSPLTSSAGRLFDAVASLTGLRQQVRFEAQAAMELEFALEGIGTNDSYPFSMEDLPPPDAPDQSPARHSALIVDWSPLVAQIIADVKRGVPPGPISARFHNALVEIIVTVARAMGQERVVLSGGCFQNRYLTERAVQRLQAEGFRPYWHQRVPPNDGGIALGQVLAALHPGTALGRWQ